MFLLYFSYFKARCIVGASSTCCACVFAGCISGQCREYHTLSRRHWEYGYSQCRRWEHHTLSTAPWEYDTHSTVWSCYYATLTAAATKTKPIGDYDNRWFTTIVKSALTAPPIGLLLKVAKFCLTSNILLVGCWRRHALLRLYFNSSVSSWLVGRSVCWSTILEYNRTLSSRKAQMGFWTVLWQFNVKPYHISVLPHCHYPNDEDLNIWEESVWQTSR